MEFNAIEFLYCNGLLENVVKYLGGPYMVTNLRETCKAAALLVPKPKHMTADCLLLEAAAMGDRDLVLLAKSRGAKKYKDMMIEGAFNGHESICRFAKEWYVQEWHWHYPHAIGSIWSIMLFEAARGGHASLCRLIKEWCENEMLKEEWLKLSCPVETWYAGWWNMMLQYAAAGGKVNTCELAKEWGACNWNMMLEGGWISKNVQICKLAIDWGADQREIEYMAGKAAYHGYEPICKLVIEYVPNFLNRMLYEAAFGGQEQLCIILKEGGANDWELMLQGASSRGSESICRLAKEWGATGWENMLLCATGKGNVSICKLAKEWGARGYVDMYLLAAERRQHLVFELAKQWLWETFVTELWSRITLLDIQGLLNAMGDYTNLGRSTWYLTKGV